MLSPLNSEYVPPEEAFRKLEFAWKTKASVYIYGVSGYGKTRLVREFTAGQEVLWISAYEENADILLKDKLHEETFPACVVIDDLQFTKDSLKKIIPLLVKCGDIRLILIGRMPPQEWIFSFMEEGRMIVISEEDLKLTGKEIQKMAENQQLLLEDEKAEKIAERWLGNPYMISVLLRMMKSGYSYDEDLKEQLKQLYEQHLEQNIIIQWSTELQEFLMQISIVDSFTLQLAVMITGDDQAAALIQSVAEIGNFLLSDHGTYRLRPQLINALRQKALKVYGLKKYRQLQKNAGLFYETQGDILSALKMYEQCENREGIRSVLIRTARRHPGLEKYDELKQYYLALKEEEVQGSIVLMSKLSMIYSVRMNREKSEYWYEKLKEYADLVSGIEQEEARVQLVWLDIELPHRKSTDIIDIFTNLPPVFRSGRVRLPDFSLTNNQPGLMNGAKDFCAWSKNDEQLAKSLGSTAENLLASQGKGLVHTALAESFYEKGKPVYDVLNHLTLARIEIEGSGRDELLFVLAGIQARMNAGMGNGRYASELLDGFEKRILEEKTDSQKRMMRNLNALRCRMSLLYSDMASITEWLRKSPDESGEFSSLDRYSYLVKARVYLALGRNHEALYLLNLLRGFAEWGGFEYINMETGLLLSIAFYRMKKEWKNLFAECLGKAFDYGFTKIISEEGTAVLPLLKKMKSVYIDEKSEFRSWFDAVLSETEQMASHYPGYLRMTPQKNEFSENGLKILKLQADGKNIREIAALLGISERTVKYHAAENYRKLGAKGKTDAVHIAQNLNIL